MKEYDGCAGKVRHQSYTRASQVARRQSQRHHAKFSAYACELCHGFHTGTHIGHGDGIKGPVEHLRYAVFAAKDSEPEVLFGWSNDPEGGVIAEVVTREPGWRVTRVIERKGRRAA